MAQLTLLEKAKQIPKKNSTGLAKQELELAVAWANNEIDLNQVRKAINTTSPKLYVFLAYALKNYISMNPKIHQLHPLHTLKVPSDNEILKHWHEGEDDDYENGAIDGARWMRDIIIQKNQTL